MEAYTTRIRTALRLSLAAVGTACVLAFGLVAAGYVMYPADFWHQRLAARMGSPIFSGEGAFLGVLYPDVRAEGVGADAADYGYIPLDDDAPETWTRFVTHLEQRTLRGPRSICGIDPLATLARVVTGTGGGSGLAQQSAKQLMQPDHARRPGLLAVADKLIEMGAACSLHRSLGGPDGVLRVYAEYAPVAQVGGTTRGVAAGSWIVFGRPPAKTSPAQLAILAASVQRPLAIAPPELFADGCEPMLRQRRPSAGPARNAWSQCWVLRRARQAIDNGLQGQERVQALQELDTYERTGIQPVNPFQPVVGTRRIVNLVSRTRALLPSGMLARLSSEADQAELVRGRALVLALDRPHEFDLATSDALTHVARSELGRASLCSALVAGVEPPLRCPGVTYDSRPAHVVMARMSAESGAIERLYESDRLAWSARESMGSLSKIPVAVAALRAGFTPDSLVCPRQARDGARLLRRVTRPVHGYVSCRSGDLIPLREMMARSDSLAAYELARQLPTSLLLDTLSTLGLRPPADTRTLAFELAFGTLAASPAELLRMGQIVFAAAYGLHVAGLGPSLLAPDGHATDVDVPAVLRPPARRSQLRDLVEAPVTDAGGTLHHLRRRVEAGKTGTTSSAFRAGGSARPYLAGKFVLAYVTETKSVVLASFNAAHGAALASPDMRTSVLTPALLPLLD